MIKSIFVGEGKVKIKDEWKVAVLTTWIVGLLAHAYRFFNFLPSWDSLYNFMGVGATYGSGRWLLPYVGLMSSSYDLSWVNGALSLFYASVVIILLVELFELKNRGIIFLSAALIVSFPTMVANFAFMFTADVYMLSFLLSVLAVYAASREKIWGMFIGMVCLALSMGIYQAYIGTAIVIILIYVIKQFAIEGLTFMEAIKRDLKYPGMLVGGGVLYMLIQKLFMAVYHYELSPYQGINQMGVMSLGEYKLALLKTKYKLQSILGLYEECTKKNYTILNAAVLILIAVLVIYLLVTNRVYEKKLSFAATIVAVLLLPVGAYAVNFTSPDVDYHTLMEMGVCFIYFLLLILINQIGFEKMITKVLKWGGIIALSGIIYYNVLNANVAYFNMNLSYQKSYAVAENVLDRMESLDEFRLDRYNRVAIMGRYDCPTEKLTALVPSIVGVSNDSFLNDSVHYAQMWEYCFGITVEMVSWEDMLAVQETQQYKDMPAYPANGSVQYNAEYDCIVIKLAE